MTKVWVLSGGINYEGLTPLEVFEDPVRADLRYAELEDQRKRSHGRHRWDYYEVEEFEVQ